MGSLLSIPLHRLELISFSANLATSVAMATLFLFLGLVNIFMGSLVSIPLHRLWLISFSPTPGNVLPWQHFFSVSWAYKYFMGSLLSIPLHRLWLISFSATPGNKCCHGNTFFRFLGLQIFYGFFAFHAPAQTGAD